MMMILKISRFVVHFPLSIFLFFRGKNNLNELSRLHAGLYVLCIIAVSLFLKIPQAESSFMENIAVDVKAISLGNAVTAYPPGAGGSINYNPAGLSLMGDGNWNEQGLLLPVMSMRQRYDKDPNWEEFHDFQGNVIHDPAAGKDTSTTSGKMYIPIVDVTMDFLISPTSGFSFREPGSKWTFGYSMYAPAAGGYVYGDEDNPSRYEIKSVYLQHIIYFGPALSYRVNKNLSIGAALGVGQTAMGMEMDMRAPNEIVNMTKTLGDATQGMSNPIFDVMGVPMPLFGGGMGTYDNLGSVNVRMRDDFSPSFNLGALWEPYDWITFGLSYNSAINSHLTGKYSFKYSQEFQNYTRWSGQNAIMQIGSMVLDLPYESVAEQTGTVTMDMTIPQLVNFGIKFKPIKRLSLMGDLHWANWSAVKEYKTVFDQKIQFLQQLKMMGVNDGPDTMIMKKNMKDTLNWAVGVEYQALDWLALRAGYENRTTSANDAYYDVMSLPTLQYYGCGLGIKGDVIGFKDTDLDLSLGYVTGEHTTPNGASESMNSTVLGQGSNNPYRGLNVTSGMAVYLAGFKLTSPLDPVLDGLSKKLHYFIPSKSKAPAKGVSKAGATGKPVDSSSTIVNNLRPDGKSYYIEDSE